MKHILLIIIMIVTALNVSAEQDDKKFNPQQFRKDQESFIIKDARLSPQEAGAFFPLFRELQDKQRALFNQQMRLAHQRPGNDKEAAKLIEEMDEIEMKIAKLKSQYHTKFCKVIPAMKVQMCIKAEEKFKRRVMDNLVHRPGPKGQRPRGNDRK